MTIYHCSVCGGTHDTANPKDKPCPQVIGLSMSAATMPISPDEATPLWMRRYFCPQCERYAQPRDGFGLPDFVEHAASHSSAYLREALSELRCMDGALRELEANANAIPKLRGMYIDLAMLRAFHRKDKAALDAWVAKASAAKPCPSCTSDWTTPTPQSPPAKDRPAAGKEKP